jgi:hypothetical protein
MSSWGAAAAGGKMKKTLEPEGSTNSSPMLNNLAEEWAAQ